MHRAVVEPASGQSQDRAQRAAETAGPAQPPLLSVIIPLGPAETGLGQLAADLLLLPPESEIVLVCCPQSSVLRHQTGQQNRVLSALENSVRLRWIEAPPGRARQLNAGAHAARGRYLWFVHADSGFTPWVVEQLLQGIRERPQALHFFRLRFSGAGGGPTALNAAGANLRSGWLGVPFGDQGFCLSATQFRQLAGYDEQAPYGEDHLLLWHARRAGIALSFNRAVLTTSARKYRQRGWAQLTLLYQWLWLKQALPQAWALWRGR